MKKSIALFSVLALSVLMSIGFSSCTHNVNTDDAIAVFEGNAFSEYCSVYMTVLFFDDGEYRTFMWENADTIGSYELNGTFDSGKLVLEEKYECEFGKWHRNSEIIDCTIVNGVLKNKYGNFKRTK
ncbi:MAG: hypothetical protein II563_06750 [Treponema sp.]|nr:hypothetical protein [Treponema sp.]MBQ5385410.1 hypothetical protein [Treponema sp.]